MHPSFVPKPHVKKEGACIVQAYTKRLRVRSVNKMYLSHPLAIPPLWGGGNGHLAQKA